MSNFHTKTTTKGKPSTAIKTALTAFLIVLVAVAAGCGSKKSAHKTKTTATTTVPTPTGTPNITTTPSHAQTPPKTHEQAGDRSTTKSRTTTNPKTGTQPAVGGVHVVTVGALSTKFGEALFDGKDQALYAFAPDAKDKSTCYGQCAKIWHPLLTSTTATAETGTKADLFGTTKRRDGKKQATYNGHPLYTYTGDTAKRDVNGQKLDLNGGFWYLINPAGQLITK